MEGAVFVTPAVRTRPPNRRDGETFKLGSSRRPFEATIGPLAPAPIAEIFFAERGGGRSGDQLDALFAELGIEISRALQSVPPVSSFPVRPVALEARIAPLPPIYSPPIGVSFERDARGNVVAIGLHVPDHKGFEALLSELAADLSAALLDRVDGGDRAERRRAEKDARVVA